MFEGPPALDLWASSVRHRGQPPRRSRGELWNEPFPGDVYDDAKFRDDAYADEHNLQPWYRNLTAGIRTKSQGMLLAYEPSWPVGSQDLRPDDVLSPTSGLTWERPGVRACSDGVCAGTCSLSRALPALVRVAQHAICLAAARCLPLSVSLVLRISSQVGCAASLGHR